jgi:glycine/D-amino acid oxidase-like deaminating enzyme
MRPAPRIAVLGAGIMGSCAALLLARRGAQITLFDAADAPFAGASRWNEGKIHLGCLYAGDASLRTAKKLLPGGLSFRPLVEDLLGESLAPAISEDDDTYAVHRDSVVGAEAMRSYLDAVLALARKHPDAGDYLVDPRASCLRPLSARELEERFDPAQVRAAFRVPERSVDTRRLADRFVAALSAAPGIALQLGERVQGVQAQAQGARTRWRVQGSRGNHEGFDSVVNALWQGRPQLDAALGLPPPPPRVHRYRVSAFVQTRAPLALGSAVLATGPFGDVKRYSPTRFYLSWYAAGLLAEGDALAPPPTPTLDAATRARVRAQLLAGLAAHIPDVARIGGPGDEFLLGGGWVYALGAGRLDDAHSSLHRRDRVGITRHGDYYSVDTGKYSIAPWLALQLAGQLLPA